MRIGNGGGTFRFKANPEIAISCFGVSVKENVKNTKLTGPKSNVVPDRPSQVRRRVRKALIHSEGVGGLPDSRGEQTQV